MNAFSLDMLVYKVSDEIFKKFGVDIFDDDFYGMDTVQDLIDHITKHMKNGEARDDQQVPAKTVR